MKGFSFFKKKEEVIEKSPRFDHWPKNLQPIEPDKLLAIHHKSVHRLKLSWSDATTWDRLMLPLIKQYAMVTQRLSYQSRGIFSQTDGLFLAGIQATAFAIDIMEESVHLERNIMSQTLLQSRLKGAAACATLLSFLHTLIYRMEIQPANTGYRPFFEIDEETFVRHTPFNPLATTYYQWAKEVIESAPGNLAPTPQLSWKAMIDRSEGHSALNLFLAQSVLTNEMLTWLGEAGLFPLMELMQSLTQTHGTRSDSSLLRAKELGIYRASQLEREKLGAQLGETLAPLGWEETLIRLLRARIVYDWDVNSKDSPLRLGSDGLFLFWPDVCPILINDLAQRGLTELPNDPDLWAGLFLKEGITEPSHRNQAVLLIAVTPNAKPRQAIKLNHKLFATHEKILLTKIPKRSFEVTDLSFTQETALSELNRQMLETLDDAFRTDAPDELQATPKRLYQFQSKKKLSPDLQNALDTLFERLTTNPILIQKHLIDEGLLVTESLLTGIGDLSPNLLIMQLHTEALIESTPKGEPRFVEHHPADGSTIRGVILKPAHITSVFLNGKDRQEHDFSKTFKALFHRDPKPMQIEHEHTTDNPQLSLNLESDE